jgi:hypothetical protein
MARETAFAEQVAGPNQGYDRLFAGRREHGQRDGPRLKVPDVLTGVPLREDDGAPLIARDHSCGSSI